MSNPHHQLPAPSIAEIAELTAWCRRLSEQGHVDPDERAAYQAAKATLIGRLTNQPHPQEPQ